MGTRSFVDLKQRPCTGCGEPTFMSNAVCPLCEDAPDDKGFYRCCGGFSEHLISCVRGAAVEAARWSIARAQAKGAA